MALDGAPVCLSFQPLNRVGSISEVVADPLKLDCPVTGTSAGAGAWDVSVIKPFAFTAARQWESRFPAIDWLLRG